MRQRPRQSNEEPAAPTAEEHLSARGFRGSSILTPETWHKLGGSLRLSPRESEIVQMIFDDRTESQMAAKLSLSAHTVHTYLERLYRKLGVCGRCQVIIIVLDAFLAIRLKNTAVP